MTWRFYPVVTEAEFGFERPQYVIRTPEGYVGRYSLTGDLQGDMSINHAYCYETPEQAAAQAELVPAETTIWELR